MHCIFEYFLSLNEMTHKKCYETQFLKYSKTESESETKVKIEKCREMK